MASQKIGALWAKQTTDGRKFLTGVISDLRGDINIAVFKNDRKERENQPDYNIVRSEQREQKKTQIDDFLTEDQLATPEAGSTAEPEINVDNIPW